MARDFEQERKNKILEILYRHSSLQDSITWEALSGESLVRYTKVRKIIFELAVKDKIPIALNPNPPYGLYIKDGQG